MSRQIETIFSFQTSQSYSLKPRLEAIKMRKHFAHFYHPYLFKEVSTFRTFLPFFNM